MTKAHRVSKYIVTCTIVIGLAAKKHNLSYPVHEKKA